MTQFDGAVEELTPGRISGWVSMAGREAEQPGIFVRFLNGRLLAPSAFPEREGATGFRFDLPTEFSRLSLREFLDIFEAVYATDRTGPQTAPYMVPLYKSVLLDVDQANRTTVVAARLREYAWAPRLSGRIAVFTIACNEFFMLPLWARYYAGIVGVDNLFVTDHGSSRCYDEMLPRGVNLTRIPRDTIDLWQTTRIAGIFQRYLLESYDTVIYAAPDDFICADPAFLGGWDLRGFLLSLRDPIAIGSGYGLVQYLGDEPAYDPTRPVLDQRRHLWRDPSKDKPLLTRIPVSWTPGFHSAVEGGTPAPGLYTVNLGLFDLGHALATGRHYREATWSPRDIEENLAGFQREPDDQIVATFRRLNEPFGALADATFDPAAEVTVVPDWMRAAIRI